MPSSAQPPFALALREVWLVQPNEVDDTGVLGPASLTSRAIAIALRLVSASPRAVSIHDLRVSSSVPVQSRLTVSAALESADGHASVVSVVIRRGDVGDRAGVVAAGTLHFATDALLRAAVLPLARSEPSRAGLVPVEARFVMPADAHRGHTVMQWVQSTALVSAQGFAGAQTSFQSILASASLANPPTGLPVVLSCSVVHVESGRLTVLSELRDDASGSDLMLALIEYRCAAVSRHTRGPEASHFSQTAKLIDRLRSGALPVEWAGWVA